LKEQREQIEEYQRQERHKEAMKRREQVKELYCMGIAKKAALGPNPLSVKRSKRSKGIKKDKPRRKRKGKRSKDISTIKKMGDVPEVGVAPEINV
jgi:hypothetical protein